MRGSGSQAWRMARATALNMPSMTWWVFSPASWRMCSVTPALAAKAMKNSFASVASKAPTITAGTSASQYSWPRPEMSTAAMMSASSMGMAMSPKRRMPRLSPSACANACPMTMPVSSTE